MTGLATRGRAPPAKEAIQLGVDTPGKGPRGVRFGLLLVVFMRLIAGLWTVRGLMSWYAILSSPRGPFEMLDPLSAAAIVFFAIADLLAAVGLWLASPWGGVLWLFAAASGLVGALTLPPSVRESHLAFGADVVLIVAYFVLSWCAAREREY